VNKVQASYDYTMKLLDLLENKPEMDRDEKIRLITEVIEMREKEISDLSAPYTAEEMKLGKQVVDLNKKLETFLSREKLLIQKDMKALQTKKVSNQKYSNPYEGFSMGGVFYDKRN
jgi:flagellar protein FliT